MHGLGAVIVALERVAVRQPSGQIHGDARRTLARLATTAEGREMRGGVGVGVGGVEGRRKSMNRRKNQCNNNNQTKHASHSAAELRLVMISKR